jgi:hypothetical protein
LKTSLRWCLPVPASKFLAWCVASGASIGVPPCKGNKQWSEPPAWVWQEASHQHHWVMSCDWTMVDHTCILHEYKKILK